MFGTMPQLLSVYGSISRIDRIGIFKKRARVIQFVCGMAVLAIRATRILIIQVHTWTILLADCNVYKICHKRSGVMSKITTYSFMVS